MKPLVKNAVLLIVAFSTIVCVYFMSRYEAASQHGNRQSTSVWAGKTTYSRNNGDNSKQTGWTNVQEVLAKTLNQSIHVLTHIDQNNHTTKIDKSNIDFKRRFWDDSNPDGWKRLPLKRHQDGSIASGVIEQTDAIKCVIYNRIPKAGSRVFLSLVERLASQNGFHMISSVVYDRNLLNKQKQFAMAVGRIQTPFIIDRHLYFLNFTEFNMAQPTYINIIRDPLSRMVSAYNFNRFGDGTNNKFYTTFKGNKHLTLTDCIMTSNHECTEIGAFTIIPFFCGQNPRCRKPSQWSLNRAIANVERYYLVVGITEYFEDTLKLFETILPTFFQGMVEIYNSIENSHRGTQANYRYTPSPAAKDIMRERLHYEYLFYNFIKNRFEKLKTKLMI